MKQHNFDAGYAIYHVTRALSEAGLPTNYSEVLRNMLWSQFAPRNGNLEAMPLTAYLDAEALAAKPSVGTLVKMCKNLASRVYDDNAARLLLDAAHIIILEAMLREASVQPGVVKTAA
jgi:hypothetical protein